MAEGVDHWLLTGCFQPETLSKSTLTEILKKRNIYNSLVKKLDLVDNEQLCSFYHRFLMPQPQRKYGNNRRGRRMSTRQSSRKKRKIPDKNSCTSLGKEGSKKFAPNSTGFNLKNETKPNKILSPTSKGMKSEDSTRKSRKNNSTTENDYEKDSKRRKITWP